MPSRREERVATVVVVVATVWFALALCWGLDGPIAGGHWAIVGSRGIMAENILTWHIWGPVRDYVFTRPTPQQYYVHHPWGTYWVIAGLMKIFGRHTFVPRLEPILMSIGAPPLLYGIGRVLWGPLQGALAAMAYVVLPIALAFGNFPGFEVPLNFGCLLTTWGYVRFQQHWQRRWMAVSLLGVLWCVNTDWEACVFLCVILLTLVVAAFFFPRWFGHVNARRFAQWWSLAAGIAAITVLAYALYVRHIGLLSDLFDAENEREGVNSTPLSQVLEARRYWIDLSFTPVAILVGKIALPIFLFRVFIQRRTLEVFPLAILIMATVEYVHFRNGADVHTYWPLPFAPYWALSLGVLADTALGLARLVATRLDAAVARDVLPLGALASVGILPLILIPDGIRCLEFARKTGGRLNDRGKRIVQGIDKFVACEWMAARMKPTAGVLMHGSIDPNWATRWALHRPTSETDSAPDQAVAHADRYFVANLSFMRPSDQRQLADEFHLVVVGPYVMVDRAAPYSPAEAYVFEPREPNLVEWYLGADTDPIRTIRPDPWYTWEVREQFGQEPNPPPADEAPSTLEELRIAHNVAVAGGRPERAEELKAKLVAQLDTSISTSFSDGTALLGKEFAPGIDPVLQLFFLASGPANVDDRQFEIQSTVKKPPPFSLVGPDDTVKHAGMPFTMAPRLWKAGFIYVNRTEIRHRLGLEVFSGFFSGGSESGRPKPLDGAREVSLLTIP